MSGTSLDGIDVALIRTDGENIVERGPSQTYAYSEVQRGLLQAALKDAKGLERRDERPFGLAKAEAALTEWHLQAVESYLKANPAAIDVIGFHGQTVIHRPEIRLTVQLGDGGALAKKLGVPVVYDIRAADVATGGQGAPFVPVYHRALAASVPERPVVFVNIGGVSNITWIGPQGDMIAFDTGPGNALIDDWALKHTGVARDNNGALAAGGSVAVFFHMMNLTILGATGSIGVSTLDVVARHPDRYKVVALSGHTRVELLADQCHAFNPAYAVVGSATDAQRLTHLLLAGGVNTQVLHGTEALAQIASLPQVDAVNEVFVWLIWQSGTIWQS